MNPNVVLKEEAHNFFSKRKIEKQKLQFGFTSTYVIMLSVIGFLLIYYVWILNVNATKGFNIRNLEIEKRNLMIEKERLDVKIADLESIKSIEEWESGDMVPIEDPDYLVIKSDVQYVYNN